MLPRNDRCHSAVVAAALHRLSAPSEAGLEETVGGKKGGFWLGNWRLSRVEVVGVVVSVLWKDAFVR
jgi:hypothetical protein